LALQSQIHDGGSPKNRQKFDFAAFPDGGAPAATRARNQGGVSVLRSRELPQEVECRERARVPVAEAFGVRL